MGNGFPRLRTIGTLGVALVVGAATATVASTRTEAVASRSPAQQHALAERTRLTPRETALLFQVNTVRAAHGLATLRVDPRLVRAARRHTAAIVRSGVFEHGKFWVWIEHEGVTGGRIAETLGWTAPTEGSERRIVNGWLHSPRHRAILLGRAYRDIGIGVHVGTFKGRPNAAVATADFHGPA